MDPISTLELEGLRAAQETNVFAPLRLSSLFADSLAESKGSIIMLNSCVVYSSQPEYSGYKLSKGTLEHLASSLATEFGPRGIRVNSVAPSYIYEDVNKAYFDWIARSPAAPTRRCTPRRPRRQTSSGSPRPTRWPTRAVPGERPGVRGHRLDAQRRLRRVPLTADMTHQPARRRVLRRHRRGRRTHDRPDRLRRHRPRRGPAAAGRRPGLPRGRADAGRQLLPPRQVKSALVGRLMTQPRFAEFPEHADVPIERPIFVVGLPRTGTTALHRLLCADPGTRDSSCG